MNVHWTTPSVSNLRETWQLFKREHSSYRDFNFINGCSTSPLTIFTFSGLWKNNDNNFIMYEVWTKYLRWKLRKICFDRKQVIWLIFMILSHLKIFSCSFRDPMEITSLMSDKFGLHSPLHHNPTICHPQRILFRYDDVPALLTRTLYFTVQHQNQLVFLNNFSGLEWHNFTGWMKRSWCFCQKCQ